MSQIFPHVCWHLNNFRISQEDHTSYMIIDWLDDVARFGFYENDSASNSIAQVSTYSNFSLVAELADMFLVQHVP